MKRLLVLVCVSAMSVINAVQASDPIWAASGFKQPESVLFGTANEQKLVSNINGLQGKEDGNGFISSLGVDGEIKHGLMLSSDFT